MVKNPKIFLGFSSRYFLVEAITQNFSVPLEVMGNAVPKEEKKTIGGQQECSVLGQRLSVAYAFCDIQTSPGFLPP